MTRLLSILLLCCVACMGQDSPFKNLHVSQNMIFLIPTGYLSLSVDGTPTWPQTPIKLADGTVITPTGIPSADTRAFCDALVTEKDANPATVNPRVNKDDNADASYDMTQAITDWNELVTTLKAEGKPHTDNTKQARAAWKMLRKLFPHVFQ